MAPRGAPRPHGVPLPLLERLRARGLQGPRLRPPAPAPAPAAAAAHLLGGGDPRGRRRRDGGGRRRGGERRREPLRLRVVGDVAARHGADLVAIGELLFLISLHYFLLVFIDV